MAEPKVPASLPPATAKDGARQDRRRQLCKKWGADCRPGALRKSKMSDNRFHTPGGHPAAPIAAIGNPVALDTNRSVVLPG
jgi:hypothetical protein